MSLHYVQNYKLMKHFMNSVITVGSLIIKKFAAVISVTNFHTMLHSPSLFVPVTVVTKKNRECEFPEKGHAQKQKPNCGFNKFPLCLK